MEFQARRVNAAESTLTIHFWFGVGQPGAILD